MTPSADRIRPITVTIGGIPDLPDIVGRDRQVDTLVGLLDGGQSAVLTGDRRMGKTSVARLVEARLLADGRRVARVSAERETLDGFVDALTDALDRVTPGSRIRSELDRWGLRVKAGPVEAKRTAAHRTLDRIVEAALPEAGERPLVLIVDEIPVLAQMLERQAKGSGAEVLVTLRRLRQEGSGRISMLLLGSVGFHHVSDSAPGEVNDVSKEPVGALSVADATYLARCLLLGEQVPTTDDRAVAGAAVAAAEAMPFYVQHLVKACRNLSASTGHPVHPEDVDTLVEVALTDPDDPWELRHYRRRVPSYYGPGNEELITAILDSYADADGFLGVDAVLRQVASTGVAPTLTRRQLVDRVEKLEQDHY
ncbi:MAG TPA: ATP-binding protein, partial [Candidatus Lustribacter sp.]|nr:ATP-binding protein [Candidatus Lustribacter sp.]